MPSRLLGLLFLITFAWFLVRRKLNREQFLGSVLLLTLGLGQGLMGWFMVQSGLIDVSVIPTSR